MFGSALSCLQNYMKEKLGEEKWEAMLVGMGLPANKVYRSVLFYPDTEFEGLLSAGSIKLGVPRDKLQRELGRNFGNYLARNYSAVFFSSWRALEVIEKAAPKVFKTIQMIDPYTPKSSVRCERIAPDQVVVHYQSPRRMCSYIMGIIEAMGDHFHEKLEVSHGCCMHQGASECEIYVKLLEVPTQGP